MAALGKKGGALISREGEYLSNVLNLREVPTEEVLTPRTVVHMLDQTLTVTEALDNPRTRQFSRIPVYGENTDDITGKVLRDQLGRKLAAAANVDFEAPVRDRPLTAEPKPSQTRPTARPQAGERHAHRRR